MLCSSQEVEICLLTQLFVFLDLRYCLGEHFLLVELDLKCFHRDTVIFEAYLKASPCLRQMAVHQRPNTKQEVVKEPAYGV
ncbi:hypothetical protein HAX54_022509 [Datura stramonium]|uniref:Uncharacterized protein n=1 Tax=Datura stramonium TaxID=4076 RepID=A0ABS8UUE7_DATST|nr:hypothetical protein [Datura stramonium]